MRQRLATTAALVAVAVAALVATSGGDDSYHLRMRVANAEGVYSGSPVVIGGVRVGKVEADLRKDGRVDLDIVIRREHAPVGKDVRVAVRAINLLGQKQVQIRSDDARTDPAPSGSRIPADRLSVSTDLDQVIDMLDPDTRVRLGILLNEAGLAVTGRKRDIRHLIAQLPPGLDDLGATIAAVNHDNEALSRLVETSDRAINEFNDERAGISDAVAVLARTSSNISSRRARLEQTVQKTPATLETLRTFLVRLKRLTVTVKPTARLLVATAPELSRALAEVRPFERAAVPTLAKATTVSDDLNRLAVGATPVLRRAVPVARQLASVTSKSLPPVTDVVDKSVDNLFAILDNWSRAIQFRDGMSHIFRGSAAITQEVLTDLINRSLAPRTSKRKRTRGRLAPPARAPQTAPVPVAPPPVSSRPRPKDVVPKPDLKPLQDQVAPTVNGVDSLLDFLLKP